MQKLHPSFPWMIAGISLGALGLLLLMGRPFTAKAQEQKQFQYQIVEVLPDTQNMQSKLNEFGANGWELVAVSMGNMTEPRVILKKYGEGVEVHQTFDGIKNGPRRRPQQAPAAFLRKGLSYA